MQYMAGMNALVSGDQSYRLLLGIKDLVPLFLWKSSKVRVVLFCSFGICLFVFTFIWYCCLGIYDSCDTNVLRLSSRSSSKQTMC